jgi:Ras-related protein Rab-32
VNAGKTCIIKRYTEGTFSPNYKLTIGVDFSLKTLEWDSRTKVNLQLWDIAGHERFNHMTRVYYKYAIAAIIVFDIKRLATFESVLKWLADVNQKVMLENGSSVPIILLANKCDLDDHQVDQVTLDAFCKTHGITAWFATSAKENKNIGMATGWVFFYSNSKIPYIH